MAESEVQHARRMSADQTISKSEIPLKERFFRYFQHEITGKFPPITETKKGKKQSLMTMK